MTLQLVDILFQTIAFGFAVIYTLNLVVIKL